MATKMGLLWSYLMSEGVGIGSYIYAGDWTLDPLSVVVIGRIGHYLRVPEYVQATYERGA